jgi:hypothetical protein
LNVRVAWHDNRWNGSVCKNPVANSYCLDLERIRAERNDAVEVTLSGKSFSEIDPSQVPPCRAESGAFMNSTPWVRIVEHPYADNAKTADTHGHLLKTRLTVKPFSTFAVPFYWMLRDHQREIEEAVPTPLPPDEESPFYSPWVFSRDRQEALCELFFSRLTAKKSLAFFYTKGGHPLEEAYSRLVVSVGRIDWISAVLKYDSKKPTQTYPLWDRMFSHSIRPDGKQGFVLPYHDYLEKTGDSDEDARRRELIKEIAVVPDANDVAAYSYAGEHAGPDIALATLTKCLQAVRRIRVHAISVGPWEAREDWLNEQIANSWADRGAFPGAGAALEAVGLRLGTALVLELLANGRLTSKDDPWPLLDAILRGKETPPHVAYIADIRSVASTWKGLSAERKTLLQLLSRFSLSVGQMKRWFEPSIRAKATRAPVTDGAVLDNPYRIPELDLGDEELPVSITTVDRGLLPDSSVSQAHPIQGPAKIESSLDWRRVRAAIVSVLRTAADSGDTLLTETETLTSLGKLNLAQPCVVPSDWLNGNAERLAGEIDRVDILVNVQTEQKERCLQLSDVGKREKKLGQLLSARAKAELASLAEDWITLLREAVLDGGTKVEPSDLRHTAALNEQAVALETVTTRKLSVLVGRAGTGKTTVLGALLKSEKLRKEGVLFLAPTGKARVRLAQKAKASAMTVAQFLYSMKRYDGFRQRPLFEGKEVYTRERTVVIDESSMLTLDDLLATLLALDLGHVRRLILVGDPNQLPPIGLGRPFADLVAHLDEANDRRQPIGNALARLTIELRTAAGVPSDTLRLASWYTREAQPVDADRVLSDIEIGNKLNDLQIRYWTNPRELYACIEEEFVARLGLREAGDIKGFNAALGLTQEGWVPFDDHDGCEKFQLLSPVRLHPHGVHELNRWIQQRFRSSQLQSARQPWGLRLGDEEIVWGDKVMLTRNGVRDGWNGKTRQKIEEYLANGEIGVACIASGEAKNKFLNIAFANRPDVRFGFGKRNFGHDSAPLELAYALTVHKAQGSEFGIVFVVIPKRTRFLSRELLYTALTRSRKGLVLLLEGSDGSGLFELARPANSDTARRNSNLFRAGVRRDTEDFPFAEHLVHRTPGGELVQSKSELAIATYLEENEISYRYNRLLEGSAAPGRVRPDFSFTTDAGNVILWEHLGMLDRDDYRRGWEWKKQWYASNGFELGKNLFTSDEGPGLDMGKVAEVAEAVQQAIAEY